MQCPHCETSYTSERCGVSLPPREQQKTLDVTIQCVLCGRAFDVRFKANPIGTWVDRFLRRDIKADYAVKTKAR